MDRSYAEDDERAPLLPRDDYREDDLHSQFCQLVGVPPSDLPNGRKWVSAQRSLYHRAIEQRSRQSLTYQVTAMVSNVLLLSQVVLGAAVTGLGAAGKPYPVITVLGALNTIIAGVIAYLKSRGQPMRARMFRDDLERVVDEIENSEIMWMGISKGVNGYDEIDTDAEVTVRSEIARLTRMYDKAVRNNTLNNPDMYGSGDGSGFIQAALKNRTLPSSTQAPVSQPGPTTAPNASSGSGGAAAGGAAAGEDGGAAAAAPVAAITPVAADPDESPATAKPTPPKAVRIAVVGDDKATKDATADSKDDKDKSDKSSKDDDKDNKDDKKDSAKEPNGKKKTSESADAGVKTPSSDDGKEDDDEDDEDVSEDEDKHASKGKK